MIYQTIEQVLRDKGADVSAAEAHGMATGMLCVDARADQTNWLAELFGNESSEGDGILVELFEQTRALLTDDDYTFDLLLPDSGEDGLEIEIEAVRDWCQGFLYGIGYSRSSSNWSGDTGEILKDIVEITKIEIPAVDEVTDEDHAAFVEIQEYLRVAVQLIRSEFDGSAGGTAH